MTYEEELYHAIGEISARHVLLDDAVAYFYEKLGEALAMSNPSVEDRFFATKLKLLRELVKRDPNAQYAKRVEKWIEEAEIANRLRNEAVHSTFAILDNDKILGPTKYLQIWDAKNIKKVADIPEMHKLATTLSVLVGKLNLLFNRGMGEEEWEKLLEQFP